MSASEWFPAVNFALLMVVIWSIWRERRLRMPYEKLFDEVTALKLKLEQHGHDEIQRRSED